MKNFNLKEEMMLRLLSKDLKDRKISFISKVPFENREIMRKFEIGQAYQIKEKNETEVELYIEPVELLPGDKIIFIKDVDAKKIKKGDKGEIIRIGSHKNMDVRLNDNKNVSMVSFTSCVYDSDYKFAHFAKVSVENKKYSSTDGINQYKEESFWLNDTKPFVLSVRYSGQLTKEKAVKMREIFKVVKPNLKKFEDEGKFAFLLVGEFEYERPKNFIDFDEFVKNQKRLAVKI